MKYKLIFTEDAQKDVLSGIDKYNDKNKLLGEIFPVSIDTTIESLQINPQANIKIYKELRKMNTRKFPYTLCYNIDQHENEIVIFAVIHRNRSDKAWKDKLKNQ